MKYNEGEAFQHFWDSINLKGFSVEVSDWFPPPQKGSLEYDALLRLFVVPDTENLISLDDADLMAVVNDPGHFLQCRLCKLSGNINVIRSCFETSHPQSKSFGAIAWIACSQKIDVDILSPLVEALNKYCSRGDGLLILGVGYDNVLFGNQIQAHILISTQAE